MYNGRDDKPAEVHIEVDGNKPLKDIELLSGEIQNAIRSEIPTMERISVYSRHFLSEKPKLEEPDSLRIDIEIKTNSNCIDSGQQAC